MGHRFLKNSILIVVYFFLIERVRQGQKIVSTKICPMKITIMNISGIWIPLSVSGSHVNL